MNPQRDLCRKVSKRDLYENITRFIITSLNENIWVFCFKTKSNIKKANQTSFIWFKYNYLRSGEYNALSLNFKISAI